MSREAWDLIKHSKRFYVRTFRWVGNALVVSTFINLFLGFSVYYVYFNQPDPDFYSTYGEVPPVPLVPMDAPNNTSVPLLANDTGADSDIRAIPQ